MTPPFDVTGAEIKAIRRALGLTQRELACVFGLSRPAISAWEAADDIAPHVPNPLRREILLLLRTALRLWSAARMTRLGEDLTLVLQHPEDGFVLSRAHAVLFDALLV